MRNRSLWIAIAIVICASIGFAALYPRTVLPPTAQGTTVKIGAILPLTGDVASWGTDTSAGIDLAVEQANTQSAGLKFQVLYENSKGEAREAIAAARKLTQYDRVVAIIGDNISGPTVAFVPIADAANVVVISPSSSTPKLTGISKYFFRIYPSDTAEGMTIARAAAEKLHLKTVSILYINNDFGSGLNNIFKTSFSRLGGRILSEQSYDADQNDFRPYLSRVAAENPDGLYIAGYYKDTGAIMKQARELGIRARFLGSTTNEDPQLIAIAGKAADGLVYPYSTGYDPESKEPIATAFRTAFQTRYHKDPGLVAALGFDCAQLIVAAVKAVGPSSEKIRDYLANLQNYVGATGAMTFTPTGDVVKKIGLKTVKDGTFSAFE